jgi:hypothetical protein
VLVQAARRWSSGATVVAGRAIPGCGVAVGRRRWGSGAGRLGSWSEMGEWSGDEAAAGVEKKGGWVAGTWGPRCQC